MRKSAGIALAVCGAAIHAIAYALPAPAQQPVRFEDVTDREGLGVHLREWEYGHGAAWGDADGDGRPDLYVGSFSSKGDYRNRIPNLLFLNRKGGFVLAPEESVRYAGEGARLSAALFADLDNDGDLDLVTPNHVQRKGKQPGTDLFENRGGGSFRRVTPAADYWPHDRGSRNVAALDLNRDGLLDLLLADGTYGEDARNRLLVLENRGGFRFEDVTRRYGFPMDGTTGLGLGLADVNDDGIFDVFVAGSNRLFVSGANGTFHEVQPGTFVRPEKSDALAAAADFGDLNGDGRPDLITTVHGQPSRIHIYLHQGLRDGDPTYVEITGQAGVGADFPSEGSTGLPLKNAFADIRDFDNDGRNDIVLAIIHRDERGQVQPVVLRNEGNQGGVPRFSRPPDASLIGYYAPAPTADYDRDGRIDIFMCPWFAETPSYLFRNTTVGGHWLAVQVRGEGRSHNPMGVGSTVMVYQRGGMDDPGKLIQRYDVAIGTGYSSGEEAIAHLGLGTADRVDVVVRWGAERLRLPDVSADRYLTVTFPAPGPGGDSGGDSGRVRQHPYPPVLPGGAAYVTDRSPAFLRPAGPLRPGVEIARTAPTVDFMYYPGQDYPGRPWSVWGDGSAAGNRFYSTIGDQIGPRGRARVYEYDSSTRKLRAVADLAEWAKSSGGLPGGGSYVPGKVHGRIDLGSDGWLYYATHRLAPPPGEQDGFRGDPVLRTHPGTGRTEIVVAHPIPGHAIPASILDPERMIFYGGTAPAAEAPDSQMTFFAYDVRNRKMLKTAPGGFARAAILSGSTGRVYWNGKRYDPATNQITSSDAPEVRSATEETRDGFVYGTTGRSAELWALDVKTERFTSLGQGAVAGKEYTAAIDADPSGRYLYYVPGAEGGGAADGTPIVQFDVRTRKRKVIAFLHPFYLEKYGYTLDGTFSLELDPAGEKLYVVWNGMRRGSDERESTALTVIHIPASERRP